MTFRPANDVSAVVLSTGEPSTQQAIDSLRRQTMPMRDVIVVRDVSPFHKALNVGAAQVEAPFFVQVDADMILDPHCVAALRRGMRRRVGIVVGHLRDPLVKQVVGVKLFRTACFKAAQFPDTVSPDTDFVDALARAGWKTAYIGKRLRGGPHPWHTFGEHQPNYSPPYTYRKFLLEGRRYRYREKLDGLRWLLDRLAASRHPAALMAQIALARGFFISDIRDGLTTTAQDGELNGIEKFLSDTTAQPTRSSIDRSAADLPSRERFRAFFRLGNELFEARDLRTFKNCMDGLENVEHSDACLIAKIALCKGLGACNGAMSDAAIETDYHTLTRFLGSYEWTANPIREQVSPTNSEPIAACGMRSSLFSNTDQGFAVPAFQSDTRTSDIDERPTKILVLIPTLEVGGAEMDLVRNLPNLDRSRFSPVVCALLGGATLSPQLTNAGIDVIPLGLEKSPAKGIYDRFFAAVEHLCRYLVSILPAFMLTRFLAAGERYIHIARSVASYIDEADVDVVHAILPSSYLIASLANMLTKRRPLAMSRLSQNWYQREIPMLGLMERWWLHRQVDIAIGNSQAVLEELRAEGIPDQKLLLMHNGIDARKFAEQMPDSKAARDQLMVPQDALVLTCVGNLYERKGHADLLSALHLVKDQLPPNWLLLAAGRDVDGNLAKLAQAAEELGLSKNVRLLGERCDVPVLLSVADIHISASWYESFPNNVLEAMSAGVPVVATSVGGVPEQVVDGLTGILVPARTPQALAEAIKTLADDAGRRRRMGRAGRKRVELEFPIEHSVGALEQAYERLTGKCTSFERNPARTKGDGEVGL